MGKKDNKLDPHDIIGPFRILLKDGKMFGGEIKGAWDNAFLVADIRNGDCIIFIDSIAVLMEGIEPPTQTQEGGN